MMKRFVIMMLMLAQVATVLAGQYELISDTLTNSKIYPAPLMRCRCMCPTNTMAKNLRACMWGSTVCFATPLP